MSASNRLFHPRNWNPKKSEPLVTQLNTFSWRLIASWNHRVLEDGIFSPLGLILLLAKMGVGGKNANLEELDEQILSEVVPDSKGLFKELDSLLDTYQKNDSLANMLFDSHFWYHQGMSIKPDFFNSASLGQKISMAELDFSAESSVKQINDWVYERIESKSPYSLDFLHGNWIISQLSNGNGSWKIPFDPHQTVRGTFQVKGKREVAVKYMRTYGNFEYQEDEEHQYVNIPLGEGLFSLVLIQTPDVHQKIKGFNIDRPKRSMIRLDIPQWHVEHTYDFKEILMDTGLEMAFDIDRADFSHISQEPIWLDQVIQSSELSLHEKGIGTPIKTSPYSGPRGESTRNVKVMRFNKPFIFLIKENMTGLILFMGKKVGK